MKIGIDIDGVLNSQYNFCIEYGSKFCAELGKYKIENVNAIDTTEIFLWDDYVAHQFWNKYREELVLNLPAKKFASEIVDKLKKQNNEIYIITARRNNDEWFCETLKNDVEGITKKWLKAQNIYYDKLIFDVKNKGDFCKENNIDFMIEDDPKNLKKLIGNTNVIVFDYPYNRSEEFKDLIRVYSWYDIFNKINSFEVNKK